MESSTHDTFLESTLGPPLLSKEEMCDNTDDGNILQQVTILEETSIHMTQVPLHPQVTPALSEDAQTSEVETPNNQITESNASSTEDESATTTDNKLTNIEPATGETENINEEETTSQTGEIQFNDADNKYDQVTDMLTLFQLCRDNLSP